MWNRGFSPLLRACSHKSRFLGSPCRFIKGGGKCKGDYSICKFFLGDTNFNLFFTRKSILQIMLRVTDLEIKWTKISLSSVQFLVLVYSIYARVTVKGGQRGYELKENFKFVKRHKLIILTSSSNHSGHSYSLYFNSPTPPPFTLIYFFLDIRICSI